MLRSLTSPQFHLAVVLPDTRGYLGDITLDEAGLNIDIAGTLPPEQRSVVVLASSLDGTQHRAIVDSPESTAHVQLPEGDLRSLQIYVLKADGECLDEFYEDQHRCTRPQRVLGSVTPVGLDNEVVRAMELGEGETIEFKAIIPTGREDAKSRELLEVACAFANTHGGSIFIGISNNVEITGLERHLVRAGKGDLTQAREEYASAILRLLHEGLTPNLVADIQWLKVAGHDVLRVAIQGHPTNCYALAESADVYVRHGANCAKARPSDLQIKFGGRSGDALAGLRRWR